MDEGGSKGPDHFQDDLKRLLELLNSRGRLTISDACDALELDRRMLSNLIEELRKDNKIRVQAHYLKAVNIMSASFLKLLKLIRIREIV